MALIIWLTSSLPPAAFADGAAALPGVAGALPLWPVASGLLALTGVAGNVYHVVVHVAAARPARAGGQGVRSNPCHPILVVHRLGPGCWRAVKANGMQDTGNKCACAHMNLLKSTFGRCPIAALSGLPY